MSEYTDIAKARLGEVRSAEYEIKNCLEQIEVLENLAQSCRALSIGERVKSSINGNMMEDAIVKIIIEEGRLKENIEAWISLKKSVNEELMDLPPIIREILWSRYVLGKTDRQVARQVNYSESRTRYLRNQGLESLGKNIKNLT